MPQCSEFITLERQCTREASEGTRCTGHHAKYLKREEDAGPVRQGGCHAILTNGKRCKSYAEDGTTICSMHARVAENARIRRERQVEENRIINERSQTFVNDGIEWRLCLQILLGEWRERQISSRVFWQISQKVTEAQGSTYQELDDFYNEIRFMTVLPYQQAQGQAQAQGQGQGNELQRIATDTQNVHTKAVSVQTQKMTDILLSQVVPDGQKTLQLITVKFSKYCKIDRMSELLSVLADMNIWYEKATCIRDGDSLYRHMLNAVVAKIEASKLKRDLYRRAYEEATESVGMCCQGHLSRLVNIFSGFDSEFTSPASAKDMLQEKMARIAGTDSSVEEKIASAQETLSELQIPREEWDAWIGAL
jgi:hypothetical protein